MKKMLLALLFMIPVFDAGGATYSVDCNDPAADFSSIRDAINVATDGDTIVVKPCVYRENINFQGKALEITSLHPGSPGIVASTIITASSGYSVTFQSGEKNSSILTGLTIRGRGIRCVNSSPVISRNVITNCENNGITSEGNSLPLIRDNVIAFNSPSGIRRCYGDIINNRIRWNGPESGIYDCLGDVIGNEIADNFSSGNGGGIYQARGGILRNVIMRNEAIVNGGGIYSSAEATIDNMIIANKAGNLGGGIYGSYGSLGRNIIAGNKASFGSAISHGSAEIYNNTITGNMVSKAGTLYECTAYIENNIIAFNEGPADMAGMSGWGTNSFNCFWDNDGAHFTGGAVRGENDLIANPLFAQPGHWDANGTATDPNDDFWVEGDYHLLSEYGRWNGSIARWVYDADTSPCIDAGFGYWDWKGEYWPHGAQINQGVYGGTSQASMSPNDVGSVADLDLDGLIDFNDLMLLCQAWPDDLPLLREDLDRNGVVALPDYAILVANWAPFPLPSPNPMTWEVEPHEFAEGAVQMEASEATSSDGTDVQYRFEETTGNPGGTDSGWISTRIYTDTGLSAGISYCYKVQVRNVGNGVESEFSEAGCVVLSSPPNPSPMTWAKPPTADAFDRVSMTAAAATSTDGTGVEYYFDCVSETEGGHDRDWGDSPDYTDTVSENREYCYKVKARNKGNTLETELSVERCATTPMAPPPTPNPMTWGFEPLAISHSAITMAASTAISADGVGVEYFFWNVTRDPIPDVNNNSLWQTSPTFTDTGLSKLTTYTYKVKARNLFNKVQNDWSVARSATTPCDDHSSPWFPDGIYWDVEPCECQPGSSGVLWDAVMRAAEAEDDGSGPLEYRFVCTNNSSKSSGWQFSRCWKVLLGIPNQGLKFKVVVRDACGNQTESPEVLLRHCYPYPDNRCPPDVCDY